MARIRKGDLVVVRRGADAGKRGRVLEVLPGRERAVVEGVGMRFKHLKKTPKHPQGGRVQREAPVRLCVLMPIDPATDAPTRVAYRTVDGRKQRVGRGSGKPLDASAPAARERKSKKAEA
jgi:large subunit ribosomal protein L24